MAHKGILSFVQMKTGVAPQISAPVEKLVQE